MLRKSRKRIKVNLVDGGWDANQQANAIQNAISSGADGIVISPVDPSAVCTYVDEALDAGIEVCALTTQIGTGDAEDPVYPETVGLVGHIETEVGRTAMDIAAEALDRSGKIAIIEGTPGMSDTEGRKKVCIVFYFRKYCGRQHYQLQVKIRF